MMDDCRILAAADVFVVQSIFWDWDESSKKGKFAGNWAAIIKRRGKQSPKFRAAIDRSQQQNPSIAHLMHGKKQKPFLAFIFSSYSLNRFPIICLINSPAQHYYLMITK